MADTPGPQRAITEATPVRLTVRTLVGLAGTIVAVTFAAALWANNLQRDTSELRAWARKFDARMDRVEGALGVRTPTASLGPPEPAVIP